VTANVTAEGLTVDGLLVGIAEDFLLGLTVGLVVSCMEGFAVGAAEGVEELQMT